MSRLSQVYEERIEAALAALDPERRELLRMAAEHPRLLEENRALRARLDALLSARPPEPAGPAAPLTLRGAGGEVWELTRCLR